MTTKIPIADKNNLRTGDLTKHFKRIAIPASIGFLFNTLFNVVDTFYAGKISTDALAGLSISFPIFFLIIALSSGLGKGTQALTSISLGKDDDKEFHIIAFNSLILAVFVGLLFFGLSFLVVEPLFRLVGAEGVVLQKGMEYTSIIFFGSFFFIINYVFNGILYSQGQSKPYRNVLIIAFLANLILDPLFIFGWFGLPKLGVQGIALATIIVQFIGSIYLAYKVKQSDKFKLFKFKDATISLSAMKEILRQGIPSSLQSATIAIGVFIINYYVNRYGGSNAVAGYGSAIRIEQLALVPALGLNIAVLSIVGQNYGAKNIDRIYQARNKGMLYGVIIMLIGTAIIVPLAPYLIRIFNSNEEVVQAGTNYLRIEAIAFTTYIFLNVSVSVLQGIKKPMFAIVIGVYRQILPFGLFYLLGTVFSMGIFGVWWGIVIINWSAVFITLIYTRYQLKQLKQLRSENS